MKKIALLAGLIFFPSIIGSQVIQNGSTIYYPDDTISSTGANPFTTGGTVDADDERYYFVSTFPDTKTIERVIFRTATITTGATLQYTIETVARTANPFPTGTFTCTNSSGIFTTISTDDNLYVSGSSLTAPCAVTAGDVFAVGVRRIGGTFAGAPMSFTSNTSDFPYNVSSTSAAGYTASVAGDPCVILRYTDGTFGPVSSSAWIGTSNTFTFNSGSSPNQAGNLFKNMPFSGKIKALCVYLDLDSTTDVKIWKNNTLSYTVSMSSGDGDASAGIHKFFLPQKFQFSKGDDIRVMIAPNTTASIGLNYGTIYSTSAFSGPTLAQLTSFGDRVYLSSATNPTNASSFSNQTDSRVYMNLMISDVDYGIPGGAYGIGQ
jgi:hypothetical protein